MIVEVIRAIKYQSLDVVIRYSPLSATNIICSSLVLYIGGHSDIRFLAINFLKDGYRKIQGIRVQIECKVIILICFYECLCPRTLHSRHDEGEQQE